MFVKTSIRNDLIAIKKPQLPSIRRDVSQIDKIFHKIIAQSDADSLANFKKLL